MTSNKKDEKGKKRRDVKMEFIIRPLPPEAAKKISEAQQIQLEIIAKTNFNFFNGRKIAQVLKENHRMWRAVLLPLNLISLRDMEDGHWHADTLYIYPEDGYQFQLEEIVKEELNADEVHWIGGSDAVDLLGTTEVDGKSYVILEAWWD
jgi:hypothetical protein